MTAAQRIDDAIIAAGDFEELRPAYVRALNGIVAGNAEPGASAIYSRHILRGLEAAELIVAEPGGNIDLTYWQATPLGRDVAEVLAA